MPAESNDDNQTESESGEEVVAGPRPDESRARPEEDLDEDDRHWIIRRERSGNLGSSTRSPGRGLAKLRLVFVKSSSNPRPGPLETAYRAIGGCAGGAVTTGRTGVDRVPTGGADLDAGGLAELTGRPDE